MYNFDANGNRLPSYGEAYSAVMNNIAKQKEKPRNELKPWEDYDPPTVDEQAFAISKGRTMMFIGE